VWGVVEWFFAHATTEKIGSALCLPATPPALSISKSSKTPKTRFNQKNKTKKGQT
jgi:hypothetical protein